MDYAKIARETVREIGYSNAAYGFDADTCGVMSAMTRSHPTSRMGVDTGGAGDQGLMFGYATNETRELMPLPIQLAHQLARSLSDSRRNKTLEYLRPDGKTQVTVEYDDGRPVRVDAVVVSSQHSEEVGSDQLREEIIDQVIKPTIPEHLLDKNTKIYVNPTGRFVTGGPQGDTGLTGRKIIVDTYGGAAPHGGGAFSGKDPTKVDRSACYMARYIAKNVVAAGLADRCHGAARLRDRRGGTGFGLSRLLWYRRSTRRGLSELVRGTFNLTPKGIIDSLDLRRPIYQQDSGLRSFWPEEPSSPGNRPIGLNDFAPTANNLSPITVAAKLGSWRRQDG